MSRILLVEDDRTLIEGITYSLEIEGFEVKSSSLLSDARIKFANDKFDLILLDVMLPDGTGYELCREIRKNSETPIIFLTACDEEVNVVMGLDIGGDDYIIKPFRLKELISRIKAVLRRRANATNANVSNFSDGNNGNSRNDKNDRNNINGKVKDANIIKSGKLKLNLAECKLEKDNVEILLTTSEYKLLLLLINNNKSTLTRDRIFENLWSVDSSFVDDNTLSVYIKRLRHKIEDNPAKPEFIKTVRGIGYKWDCVIE